MYQFWAAGQLDLRPAPRNIFERIAAALRSMLGIWTNSERAHAILEYFHSGTHENSKRSMPSLRAATIEAGRNATLDKLTEMIAPLTKLGYSVAGLGSERLRDSGVPALRELADLVHPNNTGLSRDEGFLQAARRMRIDYLNRFGRSISQSTEAERHEAIEELQSGGRTRATSPAAKQIVADVRSTLRDLLEYMRDAGVRVDDLGPRYFPRVYSADTISKSGTAFEAVLVKHGYSPYEADRIARFIISNEGVVGAEVIVPGMQFAKKRTLSAIPDAELAPFMEKDLLRVMHNYISQATRRAEWVRRMGDSSVQDPKAPPARFDQLLAEAAAQGATPEQLETARDFVEGVNGSLGDKGGLFELTPERRRMIGNLLVYQNIRLLPLAIFSSIVDPLGIVVRGGTVGDAFDTLKRGLREAVSTFRRTYQKDADTEIAETLGVIEDAVLMRSIGQLYSQGFVGDTARKINDTFFRYNLMEGWTRAARVGATAAALRFLARHADGTATEHSARYLRELGLEPGEVMLLPDGTVAISQAQGLSAEQEARVKAAVNRWVDSAVLRPNAADRPIWFNDPHYALVSHLKPFIYAFQTTILRRVKHEYQHGNYRPAMALAAYVPVMIAADLMKALVQGGGEVPEWRRNWTAADYVWSGIDRAGLMGVGQFTYGGLGMLTGPTIGQLAQAVGAVGGRGEFDQFFLKSLPANALYREYLGSAEPSQFDMRGPVRY
jgi:hypothetical protein